MFRTTLMASTLALGLGALAYSTTGTAAVVQDAPTPTRHHKRLLKGVGEWEGTMTTYMPGAPSEPIAATESVVAVGEYWTQATFQCQFMGQPYTGTGCLGYDTEKHRYIGTWIDSTSTELALMQGTLDPETKSLTMRWQSPDPATGELVPHRSVTVYEGKTRTSTFYMGAGEGTRSMVIQMEQTSAR